MHKMLVIRSDFLLDALHVSDSVSQEQLYKLYIAFDRWRCQTSDSCVAMMLQGSSKVLKLTHDIQPFDTEIAYLEMVN